MSDIRKKIYNHSTQPIKTDDGLAELAFLVEQNIKAPKLEILNASRRIRLSSYKKPQDNVPDQTQDNKLRANLIIQMIKKAKLDFENSAYGNYAYFNQLKKQSSGLSNFKYSDFQEFLSFDDETAIFSALENGDLSKLPKMTSYLLTSAVNFTSEHTGSPENLPYQVRRTEPLGKDNYRIYLNRPAGKDGNLFYAIYAQKCIERGLPFDSKPQQTGSEIDNDRMVLYVNREFLDESLEILEEIGRERPELVAKFGSPIATGLNCSYYALTMDDNGVPYNYVFDYVATWAVRDALSQTILNDKSLKYKDKLLYHENLKKSRTEEFKENLKYRSNSSTFQVDAVGLQEEAFQRYLKDHTLSDNPQFLDTLKSCLAQYFSIYNYGNELHTPSPWCVQQDFFDGMTKRPKTPKS